MRAGTLKHPITITSPVETTDSYGGVTSTWDTFLQTRASIKALNGSEKYVSASIQATSTYLITIRYQTGITPKMKIDFNGRTFEITSVINVNEENRILQIGATEVLND